MLAPRPGAAVRPVVFDIDRLCRRQPGDLHHPWNSGTVGRAALVQHLWNSGTGAASDSPEPMEHIEKATEIPAD